MNDHTPAKATPRGTPAAFTIEAIERIEKTINAAPVPARPLSTADALTALAPALSKARDRGHSLAGLAQLCEAQGLHVTERSVSRAISQARAGKSTKKKTASGASSSA